MMKAFIATSLRHREEGLRIIKILESLSIDYKCCIFEKGDLRGEELFHSNYSSLVESDIFISILKDLGKDVSAEIGMAYALGKRRIGVLYNLKPSDVMPYFAAGTLVRENELVEVLEDLVKSEQDKLEFFVPNLAKHNSEVLVDMSEVFRTQRFVDGKYVKRLEKILSDRYKRPVVVTSSGTLGILIALESILKDKKEVIVPALSFSATVQAIIHAGTIPVFADISEKDWNLDPAEAEKKINKNTGAIIPVNLFGVPCDINAFERLGKKYGISIIYDSCQAFGAETTQGEIGTFGTAEIFSLDATKIVSGGLGGFVTLIDEYLASRLIIAKNFGNDKRGITRQRGLNSRMLEFSASLALHHLTDFEKNLEIVRKNTLDYKTIFSGIHRLKLQQENGNTSSPQYFGVFLDHPDPRIAYKVQEDLEGKGIRTRVYNPLALHKVDFFTRRHVSLPVTEKMHSKILCLPTHKNVKPKHKEIIKGVLEEKLR